MPKRNVETSLKEEQKKEMSKQVEFQSVILKQIPVKELNLVTRFYRISF